MSPARKPVSDKQLAANKANAVHSTGPRTPEGKARSAQNSRRHGFTASTFAIARIEDVQEIAHLKADLVSVYQPVNSQELFAIERIALAQQTLLRAARLEAGLFITCLNEALDPGGRPPFLRPDPTEDPGITRVQERNFALGEGFHRMAKAAGSWGLFLRYQAQAERHYRRAVEEFDRLKALRHELPSEPILDVQPEPDKPTYAPSPTNPNPPGAAGLARSSEAPAAPAQAAMPSRASDGQREMNPSASPHVARSSIELPAGPGSRRAPMLTDGFALTKRPNH